MSGKGTDQKEAKPEGPAEEPKVERCSTCFAPAKNRCQRCAESWYCSPRCQKVDWAFHKHLCSQVKDFLDRPGAKSVRAILFPDDSKGPKFIWLEMNDSVLNLDTLNNKFDAEEILGVEKKVDIGQQLVAKGLSHQRECKLNPKLANRQLHLLLRANSLIDGSKPNMSIGMVTKGDFHFSWRGPIAAIVSSLTDPTRIESRAIIKDIRMTDYRGLIHFFTSYGHYTEGQRDFAPSSFWWLAPALKQELISQPQFQVLIMKSEFEKDKTGSNYEAFNIGVGHPAMAFLHPCPVTVLLGIPLLLRRYPTDEAYRADAEADGNENEGSDILLTGVDPKSSEWGLSPQQGAEGTAVLMRQDQQDLYKNHLAAMFMYLVDVIGPAMGETLEEVPTRGRDEVLEMLNPARFYWYYQRVKEQNSEDDLTWKLTPDPFRKDVIASIITSTAAAKMEKEGT